MVLADLITRLQQVGDGSPVVLGLKALAHFDSSALSVLLALKRRHQPAADELLNPLRPSMRWHGQRAAETQDLRVLARLSAFKASNKALTSESLPATAANCVR